MTPVNAWAAITGSAPPILRELLVAWSRGFAPRDTLHVEEPLGPPQGRLDPSLAAFLSGNGDVAFLTRDMGAADRDAYRQTYGTDPIAIPIAGGAWRTFGFVDPVVVIVNAANPVRRLNFAQLDALLSDTRLRGEPAAHVWGDMGVTAWGGLPIHVYGGDAWAGEESARAGTVHRLILGETGRWRSFPGSGSEADAVARVAVDPLGIAFTGAGHVGVGVRVVALAVRPGDHALLPNRAAVASAAYPLVRTVDLFVAPGRDGCPRQSGIALASYLVGFRGQAILRHQPPFLPLARSQRRAAYRMIRGARYCRAVASQDR